MISTLERSLVYPAPPVSRGNWDSRWIEKEDVWFQSRGAGLETASLNGWFAPLRGAKRVVLYAHGQSEHVPNLVSVIARLQESVQASVLVYDYRGYGKSEGRPTEAGCIADGLAAQQWLAERTGVLPEDIVLIGRSLGGAVSVAVAAERGAKALVLENTFSRLTDIAAYRFPWAPVRNFMSERYDSVERIRRYHGPLLQMHGTRDRVVPAKFARQLFAACPSQQKRFFVCRGGKHYEPAPLEFYSALGQFLAEIEGGRKPLPAAR
ncbi:alpha/beta hydrolase [Botrimarina sp.]|uniref:alpha/beta hydrolase n=1 Tax=Botrimarina sp. TaxID=2795802 RepID=UPI0032EB4DC5